MALDEFRAAQEFRGKIEVALEELPPERKAGLLEALEDRTIQHRSITRVLKTWGYSISENTIRRYREEHGE